tara:strand:- start:200 stop:577 length:378 start_codon:yes stop_codon:yes gene_type:complete
VKKLIPLIIFFIFIQCSSDSSNSTTEEVSNIEEVSNTEEPSNTKSVKASNSCDDVQDALNQVYLAYSEVEAGSIPSPASLDSFLDWPLLFNETLKNNPAYSDIIASVSNFDELITNNPECLGELE